MLYNYLVIILLNSIFLYLFLLQYFDHPPSFSLDSVYPPKIKSDVESECPKIIYQLVPDLNNVPAGLYNTILNNINAQLVILSPLEQFEVLNIFIFTNAQFFLISAMGVLSYIWFTYTQESLWISNGSRSFSYIIELLY